MGNGTVIYAQKRLDRNCAGRLYIEMGYEGKVLLELLARIRDDVKQSGRTWK